jgi:hypothetical protein
VTISSLALLFLYPALCQIVLKRLKVVTTNEKNQTIKKNNVKGPGIPLVQTDRKHSASDFTKGYSVKNNNVTLNNTTPSSVKININKHDEEAFISKYNDVEQGPQDSCESCTSKNWLEMYFTILNWKWFTVRFYKIMSNFSWTVGVYNIICFYK